MQTKEQFELRIKWIEDNINLYNGYKQDAIIQRFNELRNELKKTIDGLDLKFYTWDDFYFNSDKLDFKAYDSYAIKRLKFYQDNLLFKELIDLLDDNYNLVMEIINQCQKEDDDLYIII